MVWPGSRCVAQDGEAREQLVGELAVHPARDQLRARHVALGGLGVAGVGQLVAIAQAARDGGEVGARVRLSWYAFTRL